MRRHLALVSLVIGICANTSATAGDSSPSVATTYEAADAQVTLVVSEVAGVLALTSDLDPSGPFELVYQKDSGTMVVSGPDCGAIYTYSVETGVFVPTTSHECTPGLLVNNLERFVAADPNSGVVLVFAALAMTIEPEIASDPRFGQVVQEAIGGGITEATTQQCLQMPDPVGRCFCLCDVFLHTCVETCKLQNPEGSPDLQCLLACIQGYQGCFLKCLDLLPTGDSGSSAGED